MSRGIKILILVLTILPALLFLGGYIAMMATMFTSILPTIQSAPSHGCQPDFAPPLAGMFAWMACISVSYGVGFCLLVFYICNLVVTNRVPKDLKAVWGVLLPIAPMISWIVYWCFYIWPDRSGVSVTSAVANPVETPKEDGH